MVYTHGDKHTRTRTHKRLNIESDIHTYQYINKYMYAHNLNGAFTGTSIYVNI